MFATLSQSLALAQKLHRLGKTFELHIYAGGARVLQVQRRPAAERAGADDDDIG